LNFSRQFEHQIEALEKYADMSHLRQIFLASLAQVFVLNQFLQNINIFLLENLALLSKLVPCEISTSA
jgi:hypothetical protein